MKYCEFIKKVQSYQHQVKTIRIDGHEVIDEKTFNINAYIGFFDKIYIKAGHRISFFYKNSAMDGEPILYWETDCEPLPKIQRSSSRGIRGHEESNLKEEQNRKDYIDLVYQRKIKNIIVPEDSELGFFQYLFLLEFGNQFAFMGHPNYRKKFLVCSYEQVDEILKTSTVGSGLYVDDDKLKQFKEISLQIKVIQENTSYQITCFEYRHRKGIYKCKYEIDRVMPFEIKLVSSDRVLLIGSNILAY